AAPPPKNPSRACSSIRHTLPVGASPLIPAKAGIQRARNWVPACAGTSGSELSSPESTCRRDDCGRSYALDWAKGPNYFMSADETAAGGDRIKIEHRLRLTLW